MWGENKQFMLLRFERFVKFVRFMRFMRFERCERFERFGQMEGLKIFGLGIIQQIVGVENFQPLQFYITPFTSEGEALGMGAKKGLKRYAGLIV